MGVWRAPTQEICDDGRWMDILRCGNHERTFVKLDDPIQGSPIGRLHATNVRWPIAVIQLLLTHISLCLQGWRMKRTQSPQQLLTNARSQISNQWNTEQLKNSNKSICLRLSWLFYSSAHLQRKYYILKAEVTIAVAKVLKDKSNTYERTFVYKWNKLCGKVWIFMNICVIVPEYNKRHVEFTNGRS